MLCSQGCSFHWLQRQATKDAGAISGLNVLRIIIEPTGTVETLSTSTGVIIGQHWSQRVINKNDEQESGRHSPQRVPLGHQEH